MEIEKGTSPVVLLSPRQGGKREGGEGGGGEEGGGEEEGGAVRLDFVRL